MNLCEQTRQWLFQADEFGVAADLAGHLQTCGECGQLAGELRQLEQAWRALPLPESCGRAQAAFLEKLGAMAPVPPLRRRGPRVFVRWAVAAAVLIAAGLSLWSLSPDAVLPPADIVSRLIDWNLDLSQAADQIERRHIFENQQPALKLAVRQAALSQEDQVFAENLLHQADQIASQEDPLARADQFTDLADQLVERMKKAAKKANTPDMKRLVHHYGKVMERGLGPNMDKARTISLQDGDKKSRLDKLLQREAKRQQALETLLESTPDAAQGEIRKSLEMSRKHPHRHKGGKGKGKD